MTDTELIRASLTDPLAFAGIFERHFDAVHGYAQRRAGVEVADDVAAEVFTRAFDRRRTFDARDSSARPWLLGITVNLLRDHWRSERRRLETLGLPAVVADGGPGPSVENGVGPELTSVLVALPVGDREAILLFAWADLTYEEISTALGVPLGTVRSRIFRARKRLRERLDSNSKGALHA